MKKEVDRATIPTHATPGHGCRACQLSRVPSYLSVDRPTTIAVHVMPLIFERATGGHPGSGRLDLAKASFKNTLAKLYVIIYAVFAHDQKYLQCAH